MQMLKKYIKSIILLENKFDNLPLSADLVDIMLDELLEKGKGENIIYKNVEINYYNPNTFYVHFNKARPQETFLPTQPFLKAINEDRKNLKYLLYNSIQEHIRIMELDQKFEKEIIQKYDFKLAPHTRRIPPIITFVQNDDNEDFIRIMLDNRSILIKFNNPRFGWRSSKVRLRSDYGWLRKPDFIIEAVQGTLERILTIIEQEDIS